MWHPEIIYGTERLIWRYSLSIFSLNPVCSWPKISSYFRLLWYHSDPRIMRWGEVFTIFSWNDNIMTRFTRSVWIHHTPGWSIFLSYITTVLLWSKNNEMRRLTKSQEAFNTCSWNDKIMTRFTGSIVLWPLCPMVMMQAVAGQLTLQLSDRSFPHPGEWHEWGYFCLFFALFSYQDNCPSSYLTNLFQSLPPSPRENKGLA